MARFAQLATFRTQQRSLRRTEPEDPRLAEATKKAETSRTSERSPEADRLKQDLDERTELVKAAAQDGSTEEVLSRTGDRRAIEEARSKAGDLEPEDRVEVELAITRTADVDLRASASMLGRTSDPEIHSKLDTVGRTATDDVSTSATAIRETAPSTSLPPEVVTAVEVAETSSSSLMAQIDGVARMEPVVTAQAGSPADAEGAETSAEPVSMEFDPDRLDLSGGGTDEVDHRAVLEDALADADAHADQLEADHQQASADASTSFTEVLTSGASIDTHMATLEVQSVESGVHGTGGVDMDYVLNDQSITAVLTGISDEALAKADYQVAVQRAELAELRAEVSRDFSDGLSDAFDESALAGGAGAETADTPALEPYADQVDAFAARVDVAAAEYEELTSMRAAFAEYGTGLTHDITILESRLAAAESVYVAHGSVDLEIVAAPSGGIDLVDHRLNQTAFDNTVTSLRDMSTIRAELAAKRAVLVDVNAEVELLDARVADAEEDLERAEERLEDAEALLADASEAIAAGDEPPEIDLDAVARADLEEVRDDIADLEVQLESARERADLEETDAQIAEGLATAGTGVSTGLALQDFSLGHTEMEVLFIPGTPPTIMPVTQTDGGVNDAQLRAAFDALDRDLEQRAEAAQQRAEADLADRREDELEAMLEQLQADESELADALPPDPTADDGDNAGNDPDGQEDADDGAPQATDIDPDQDLDLTGDASSSVAGGFDDPDELDAIEEAPLVVEVPNVPEPQAQPDPQPDPAPPGGAIDDSAPLADAVAEVPADSLDFGGGAPAPDETISGDEAAATAAEPAQVPVPELATEPEQAAAVAVESVDATEFDPVEAVPAPEPVAMEAASPDVPVVDEVASIEPMEFD